MFIYDVRPAGDRPAEVLQAELRSAVADDRCLRGRDRFPHDFPAAHLH